MYREKKIVIMGGVYIVIYTLPLFIVDTVVCVNFCIISVDGAYIDRFII